jgi:uncharacterized protein (DUF433 family)
MSRPLIKLPDADLGRLSFNNLIEAHIIRATLGYEVKMRNLRRAVETLHEKYGGDHPLLDRRFATDGVDLFVQEVDETVNVTRGGQLALKEMVDIYLQRIVVGPDGKPEAFFPVYSDDPRAEQKVIQIRPGYGSSRPIVAGTGLIVDVLRRRYLGGDSIEELAQDYRLPAETIREVLGLLGVALAA